MISKNLNMELIEACLINDTDKIKKLISQGADVNYIEHKKTLNGHIFDSYSALSCAVQLGYIESVNFLLENNADARILEEKPLLYASLHGNVSIIDALMSYGASIHPRMLYNLIFYNFLDAISLLVLKHELNPSDIIDQVKKVQSAHGHSFDARPIYYLCEKLVETKKLKDELETTLDKNIHSNPAKNKI